MIGLRFVQWLVIHLKFKFENMPIELNSITKPCTIAIIGLTFNATQKGLGQHDSELSEDQITYLLKIVFVDDILFDLSILFSKISALVFYRKIFRVLSYTNKAWRWTYYAILAVATAWPVAFILFTLFMCAPIEKFWLMNQPGHCYSHFDGTFSSAFSSVIIDLAILIIPLPPIWQLHLKNSRKLSLVVVFVLGYS